MFVIEEELKLDDQGAPEEETCKEFFGNWLVPVMRNWSFRGAGAPTVQFI